MYIRTDILLNEWDADYSVNTMEGIINVLYKMWLGIA